MSAELLAGLEPFSGLPPGALDALTARAMVQRYPAGAVLYREGTTPAGIHIITDGSVRVVRSSAGKRHVVHGERRGGALGEVALFDGAAYPASAVAETELTCVFVSRGALDHAVEASPDVSRLFLKRLAARARELIARLDRLTNEDTTSRLAAYLASCADGERSWVVSITQAALAEELGTVREVVVRSLRALREAGAIRTVGRGRIEVIDRHHLVRRVVTGSTRETPRGLSPRRSTGRGTPPR